MDFLENSLNLFLCKSATQCGRRWRGLGANGVVVLPTTVRGGAKWLGWWGGGGVHEGWPLPGKLDSSTALRSNNSPPQGCPSYCRAHFCRATATNASRIETNWTILSVLPGLDGPGVCGAEWLRAPTVAELQQRASNNGFNDC
jgi:hypothetical protein